MVSTHAGYGVNETIDETATLKQGRDPDYRPPNLAHIGRDDLNAADPKNIPTRLRLGSGARHEHNPRRTDWLVLVYLVMSILCSGINELLAQQFSRRGKFLREAC